MLFSEIYQNGNPKICKIFVYLIPQKELKTLI